MKISIITLMRNVDVDDTIILEKYQTEIRKVSDNPKWLEEIIPEKMTNEFGSLTLESMKNNCIAYTEISHWTLGEHDLSNASYTINRFFENLLHCLWLINDNAAYIECSYAFIKDGNVATLCKNSGRRNMTDSRGEIVDCILTNDRIDTAITFKEQQGKFITKEIQKSKKRVYKGFAMFNDPTGKNYPKLNRFEKANRFLYEARTTDFLASKLSNYMSIFETLFVTGKTEISKQIKNKVPVFLKINSSSVKISKSQLNKSYDIRSEYVHGSLVKTENEIQKQCILIDAVIREVFTIILNNDIYHEMVFMKDDELGKFLEKIIKYE
ncbi:hypothetical protein ATZ33_00800 [Enterococcus silesiacus]|uniref:Uncharacterized protein n=1 Tax=Enterococcus silesiacus TaxID=332949 RepID=A0A0S3K6X0_9ENTE|nr:HEPN domain-containing protein [Enterococcus silesiacus]ALR99969.1 hypothetical protein ATZ33_00800 [Enterococcus silesiacus]OJG92722.1 hypothetical protein RV15_GL002667 [Enterococcus silesiacus]